MKQISLRRVKRADFKFFKKWWADKDLIQLTSGDFTPIEEGDIRNSVEVMRKNKWDFMILLGQSVIGHIKLEKGKGEWYETQIVIGDKEKWGKGYGTQAITLLLARTRKQGIQKIFLEVRSNNRRAIHAYTKVGFIKKKFIHYPKNKNLPKTLRMELKK